MKPLTLKQLVKPISGLMLLAAVATVLSLMLLAGGVSVDGVLVSAQSHGPALALGMLIGTAVAVLAARWFFRSQQQDHEDLEYRVQERTLELEITLRELSEANHELEKLNTMDALTGLRNRRFFDNKLLAEARRSRREQTPLTLVMIDIDHFKQVNDTYGHISGDDCLRNLAQSLLREFKRPGDHVCRYGGEEFAIIMANTSLQGATELVERLRCRVAQTPVITESHQISLTVSAGVCTGVIDQQDQQQQLLQQADQCLYAAKQAGRNRVHSQSLTKSQADQELTEDLTEELIC